MQQPPPEPAEQRPQPGVPPGLQPAQRGALPGVPPGVPPAQPTVPPMQPAAPATPPHAGTSRRWFLAGGAALVLGAAGGAAFELVHNRRPTAVAPPSPPPALVAAVGAERMLIADLDATTGGTPAVRRVIVQARADHAAHLRTLAALLARYVAPAGSTSTATPAVRGTPRTLAQLRAAERRAAADAAARAARLSGDYAALLASIAACEAGHAELFR